MNTRIIEVITYEVIHNVYLIGCTPVISTVVGKILFKNKEN